MAKSLSETDSKFDVNSVNFSLPAVVALVTSTIVLFGWFNGTFQSKVDAQKEIVTINKAIAELKSSTSKSQSTAAEDRAKESERNQQVHKEIIENLQLLSREMTRIETTQGLLQQQGSVGSRRGWDSKESSNGHE